MFYLSLNSNFYVSKIMHLWARGLPREPSSWVSEGPGRGWWRGLVDRRLVEAPGGFIAVRPRAALLFWFFGGFRCGVPLFIVMLDVY